MDESQLVKDVQNKLNQGDDASAVEALRQAKHASQDQENWGARVVSAARRLLGASYSKFASRLARCVKADIMHNKVADKDGSSNVKTPTTDKETSYTAKYMDDEGGVPGMQTDGRSSDDPSRVTDTVAQRESHVLHGHVQDQLMLESIYTGMHRR